MEQLGAGGFGQVYRAVSVETGIEYACKSIPKRDPGAGYATSHHLLRIRGEVDAMRQLGASLDVASLKVGRRGPKGGKVAPPHRTMPVCRFHVS